MKKTPLGLLSTKQREAITSKIIDYFATERDEEIGIIAAEEMLDMFLEAADPQIFNNAVQEIRKINQARFDEINLELQLLLKEGKS